MRLAEQCTQLANKVTHSVWGQVLFANSRQGLTTDKAALSVDRQLPSCRRCLPTKQRQQTCGG